MRTRINSVQLVGTTREVAFSPGLNIITGPIASGKTTLIRLCQGLLGSGLENFPQEVRNHVVAISGDLFIGDNVYSLVRPFTSTKTAKVDIAGLDSELRLPALALDASASYTFGQWLLRTLGLPDLRVPSAPTRLDSDPSPLSINDFLLYCILTQETIDNSVCGHRDPFKNIKRKYVFEVLYGIYDTEVYRVQERLHEVNTELTQLYIQSLSFEKMLSGTPWENRAALLDRLRSARESLAMIESKNVNAAEPRANDAVADLRRGVLRLDAQMAETGAALEREKISVEQLGRLVKQLEVQSKRLTKAIVANRYLTDFDFILCPRCGADVGEERGSTDVCSLCLQTPAPRLDRREFVSEQDRVAGQIDETKELLEAHGRAIEDLNQELSGLGKERQRLGHELDYKTQTYVSDRASAIAEAASERPAVLSLIARLEDYLMLYEKLDRLSSERTRLEAERDDLIGTLDMLSTRRSESEGRIRAFEGNFEMILRRLAVPRFSAQPFSALDRRTYLPILDGRRFDELSSQGLQVLVNVAYALAHQITAIELQLPLPNILVIDGLTTNVGHEGYDVDRVQNAYEYLMELSDEMGDVLQVIVSDGNVPAEADPYVRLRLSESDRLIPIPSGDADSFDHSSLER
jgi:hypothetical protein